VCASHFPRFFSFVAIFQVLQCAFFIFHFFTVSRSFTGPTGCVSHFARFFQCFSPYSRSYHDFLIFLFASFLDIFKVLQCVFLIFHVFQFSGHITGPNVFISHFSRYSVFLAIFQVVIRRVLTTGQERRNKPESSAAKLYCLHL
jgi:hypothetical protein